MKKFTLKIKGKSYEATGESLEKVRGWEKGLPEIWKKNKSKIKELDVTEEEEILVKRRLRKSIIQDFIFDVESDIEINDLKKLLLEAEEKGRETKEDITKYILKASAKLKKTKKES